MKIYIEIRRYLIPAYVCTCLTIFVELFKQPIIDRDLLSSSIGHNSNKYLLTYITNTFSDNTRVTCNWSVNKISSSLYNTYIINILCS